MSIGTPKASWLTAIVLPGADLKVSARRLIWGKGFNAGQACIAPDHVIVHRQQREPLLAAMAEARLGMYGDKPLESGQLAQIINERQFNRLAELLAQAQRDGRVLLGGEINPEERRIAPTVIAVSNREDPLMADELFGPLLPFLALNSLGDTLMEIRRDPKPLALYLFGGTSAQQDQVLSSTSSGGVCINDVIMQAGVPNLPFGGVGASGMGSYHGQSGFDTFSHQKSVLRRPFRFDFKLRYPPYKLDLKVLRRLAG